MKPILSAVKSGDAVLVKFDKGDMEGIRLYCKRAEDAEFAFLASDTHSPYTDNRANLAPGKLEERSYYAYFTMDENEIGQKSDVITIVL